MDRDNILRDCICDQRNCGGGGGGEPDRLATRDCRHAQTRRRCNQQQLHQDATDERHDLSSSNNMNHSSRELEADGGKRTRKDETRSPKPLKHHSFSAYFFARHDRNPISRPRDHHASCDARCPPPRIATMRVFAHLHVCLVLCNRTLRSAFCLSLSLLRASVSPRLVHAQHAPTLWLLGDFRHCCLPGPRPRQEDECTARLWAWPRRLI